MAKEKAIIEYIVRWLDSNIDEGPPEGVQEDSANLKEKIELALDPKTTVEDIESGNFQWSLPGILGPQQCGPGTT